MIAPSAAGEGIDDVQTHRAQRRQGTDHRTDGRATDASLRITSDPGARADGGEELLTSQTIDPGDPDAGTIKVFVSR